jgi:hypothetical protein
MIASSRVSKGRSSARFSQSSSSKSRLRVRHAVDQALSRRAAIHQEGFRQQRAFGGRLGDLTGQHLSLVEDTHDHRAGQAFSGRDRMLDGVAEPQNVINLRHRGRFRDGEFAGPQGAVAAVNGDHQPENLGVG